MSYADDIPLGVARAAHAGTSHVPEERAVQERMGYAGTLNADHDNLARGLDAAKLAVLAVEFERYRQGYRRRMLAVLGAKSRCVSSMIAGPSNFPARRMEKRGNTADKRVQELIEFRTRALHAIRRALHPELAPVMLGDPDADARLRAKIAEAEAKQARMKAANVAIRANAKAGAEAQVAALGALGIGAAYARELLVPDFAGRVGFAPYELTNNGAEIRRLRGRLGAVEAAHAAEPVEEQGAHARFEDVPAENRVRLYFPGKPSSDVRDRLKHGGFRWTPSLKCWQAYRNLPAIAAARREAGL